MIENIRLSFQGIWSHKMRSFLTMLGIIIGIAAIIAIVSTIQGTNDQIKQNMVGNTNHTVKVQLYKDGMEYEAGSGMSGVDNFYLPDEAKKKILDIKTVKAAEFYNIRREYDYAVFYGKETLSSCSIIGMDTGYIPAAGYQIIKGRGLTEKDLENRRKTAVVTEDIVMGLFNNENPIGKTIEIHAEPFTVVGVAAQSSVYEPVINSVEEYYMYYQNNNTESSIFIPQTVWPAIYEFDEPQNLIVMADSMENMASAGKKAADILNTYMSSSEAAKYQSEDLLAQAKKIQDLKNSTNSMLIWIASISLLVGGIGVMNIMLVSVTERTREIGLKKAIGARKGVILSQFLIESSILTSVGGILGVIAGTVLANVISRVSQVPVSISVPAIFISVGFSALIGIVFGILPSIKAANLNPIDALRQE